MANTFDGAKKAKEVVEVWKELREAVTSNVTALEDYRKKAVSLPSEQLKGLESIRLAQDNLNKAIEQAKTKQTAYTASIKEQKRVNDLLVKTKAKLEQATTKESKELARLRVELQQTNKLEKENAVLNSKMTTEYQKLVVRMNQAGRAVQNLTAKKSQGIKLSNKEQAELKQSTRQFAKYQGAVLKADASIGRFQRNVGNYPKGLRAAASAARSFASALGLVGGAFLFVQVMRDAIGIMRDFEKQNATLSAILQVEKEDMSALREEAIRLGSTTVKTAGEVTQLQIAYARLGFSQNEIIDLTESTISGSIAMNSELDKTAELVGAVVNTFDDLSTSDAPKIIDILSLSTAKSALNFSKLEVGIPIVAGAANAAGIPFTKLVALMGKLADSGIDVSSSSTALRNIFIESAKQGLNYEQIIEKIKKSQDKLTAANDEFGKRAAVSATVLSQNIDATKEFDEALQNAAGTAQSMAEKELDTLDGSVKLLKSAWEGYILRVDDSNNASSQIKDVIKDLAKNLSSILNTIVKVFKAFAVYKAIIIASSLVTRLYTSVVVALRIAKIALSGGIGKATIAMRAFNLATKANPIGLLLSVLAGGVAVWLAFRDGVNETAEAFKRLEESTKNATDEIVKNRVAVVENQLAQIDSEISNIEVANQKKLLLLNDNIDKQEKGLGNLYSTEEELQEESNKKQIEESNKKFIELSIQRQKFIDNIKSQAKKATFATDEDLSSIGLPTENKADEPVEFDSLKNNFRTEAEKQIIKKLKELRKGLLDSLKKQKEISDEENKKEDLKRRELALKDLFALEQSRLKRQIDLSKEIASNNKKTTLERLSGESVAIEKSLELLQLEKLEAIRLAKGRSNKITQINEEFKAKKIQLEESTEKEVQDIYLSKFDREIKELSKRTEAQKLNQAKELNDLKESELAKGTAIEDINKLVSDKKKEQLKEQLNAEIDFVKSQLELSAISAEQKLEVEKRLTELKGKLLDEQLNEDITKTQDYADQVRDAFSNLGDALGVSGDNLANIFLGIQNGFDNAGQAAQAFGQLANEVVNSVIEGQNRQLENQINVLDQEKETALAFAGENAEARGEIEKQYAERKAQIQEKQAKNEKTAAITSSIINTATAVVKALPNIPLSVSVGIIGAAQTALIASQKIPQFKDGVRDFSGGLAVLGDGGVSEYARTPDGQVFKTPSKDTLYNLPKGTDVFKNKTDFDKELQKELNFNGIFTESRASSPTINVDQGITKEDLSSVIGGLEKTIKSKESAILNIDKRGFKVYQKKAHARTEKLNNRYTFRGNDV